MGKRGSKTVVAMSGGLDSSVSAALLKREGREVLGLHFTLPAPERSVEERAAAAFKAASYLGIPLKVLDMKEAFESGIITPFVDAYLQGLTPNPCVVCNESIKFRHLIALADEIRADSVATGHYARIKSGLQGVPVLYRGRDRGKDQSYFLHRISSKTLERAVFPLGKMTKEKVKRLAEKWGLARFLVSESQEICFIEGNDYRRLVEERKELSLSGTGQRGRIINSRGQAIGEHEGVYGYTIGQRQGLGIASSRPYYVKELNPEKNEIVVGRKEELFSREARARDFFWLGGPPENRVIRLKAQVRYRHRASPGLLEVISDHEVRFVFDEPQWAITPGQALVCYKGERLVGGGWIRRG